MEEVSKYEYQVRDIGGDTYYRKQKGDKYWEFTTKDDFDAYATDKNTVKWVEKKPPKPPYVRQVDVPTTMKGKDGRIKYLKSYFENLSPNEFKGFIGEDIRLEPVMIGKEQTIAEMLKFYMGKNTPDRQQFIIDNLRVEKGVE